MEIIVLIVILVAGVAVYYNTRTKPTKSADVAPYKIETPSVLDVNKDGKVDLKDVVAAEEIVVEKVKKAAKTVKAAAKKTTAKKAPAKKTANKK
jgi:hypothetical protein